MILKKHFLLFQFYSKRPVNYTIHSTENNYSGKSKITPDFGKSVSQMVLKNRF